jgi:hypothetical protein
LLRGDLVSAFSDNDGVLHSIIKGSSQSPEVALLVAWLWHQAAVQRLGLQFGRVESKANIADGPTRDRRAALERRLAEFKEPRLPAMCEDLWKLTSLREEATG